MSKHETPDTTKETGWRGSRELWLEAALAALVEGGVDAVKVQPLANRLNLSRTSFYWFFENRKALLSGVLDVWNEKNTAALIAASEAYAETAAEAMLNVIACFVEETAFDPKLEFAVRGWALQSSEVMAKVKEADNLRLDALTDLFVRFGFEVREADVRARAVYLTQIGYISMQVSESFEDRFSRIPAYVQLFGEQAPTEKELARFRARFEV